MSTSIEFIKGFMVHGSFTEVKLIEELVDDVVELVYAPVHTFTWETLVSLGDEDLDFFDDEEFSGFDGYNYSEME